MNTQEKVQAIINNKKDLTKDLSFLVKGKKAIQKGVYFGKNVKVEPNVFFDISEGNIFINEGTIIKANSILRGPLIVGNNCVINSFTEISCSRIGNFCKIGGEVSDSIIENYSNKQHHGFLGYSYLGSWVNLGGGTSVATLKNTYNTISVNGVDTGQIFFGAILGDYAKTAINTSIFCGKVIGESSHLYGVVTEDVPAFTSHVRPGILYELPLLLAIKIQTAMMPRRGLKFTDKDKKNFEKLFLETAGDRKKAKVKKGKLKFS